MRVASGKLDRRLQIQQVVDQKDAAGDVILTEWDDVFRLWARLKARPPGMENAAEGGVLRQFDSIFQVRDGEKSRSIGPETHRILWHGRVYEIVAIQPDAERADLLNLLVSARPDLRGSRGVEGSSGQP